MTLIYLPLLGPGAQDEKCSSRTKLLAMRSMRLEMIISMKSKKNGYNMGCWWLDIGMELFQSIAPWSKTTSMMGGGRVNV